MTGRQLSRPSHRTNTPHHMYREWPECKRAGVRTMPRWHHAAALRDRQHKAKSSASRPQVLFLITSYRSFKYNQPR